MGLFGNRIASLFQGARNLFNGKPAAPSLFTGQPQQPGPPSAGVLAAMRDVGTPLNGILFGEGGRDPHPALPHADQFASQWNTSTKTYSWRWDEAYKKCRRDALAMRRDAFLTAMLFERKFPTAQMAWHLEPDNKKDPGQLQIAEYIQACVQTMPNVSEMIMEMGEDLWYGRAGVQTLWAQEDVLGQQSWVPADILPVNGDKIQMEWDGTPQVWIYAGDSNKFPKEDIVNTDRGTMLRLKRQDWRQRFIISKCDCVDADYYESDMAGGVGGVGLRHWAYWVWWLKAEISSWILDFMQRTGQGFTVYYFSAGNPADEARAIKIAKEQGNSTWIVWPREPGEKDGGEGVRRIEPNVAGADVLLKIMDYYDRILERLFIGQSMSSGADTDGSLGGSGKAKFAQATKQYIITSDCLRKAAALSRDLIKPLMRFNCPQAKFNVRWKFDIDADDPKVRLECAKMMWEMGIALKADEVREAGGFSKPAADDEQIQNQTAGKEPAAAPGGAPGGGLFEGGGTLKPGANGSANPDQEEKHKKPVRYAAKGKPMPDLSLYVYAGDDEVAEVPIGPHEHWEDFADWAAEQGGELHRLAVEGTSDPYRRSDSLGGLRDQLVDADVPERFQAIAGAIREAAKRNAADGIVVSEAGDNFTPEDQK